MVDPGPRQPGDGDSTSNNGAPNAIDGTVGKKQVPSVAMQDRPNVPLLNVPRLDRKLSNKGEQLTIDSPTFYKTEQEKVRELPVPGGSQNGTPDGHGLLKYLATAGVIVGASLIALAVRRQTRRGVRGKNMGPEAPKYRGHGYDDGGGGKKGGKKTTTVEGIKVAKEDAGVVERHLAMEHLIEEGKDPSSSHQSPELPGHAGKEISAAAVATVHAGDTMWSLSTRVLGRGEDWQYLYKACARDLGDDPRKLYVGAELDAACVKEAKRLAAEGRGTSTPPDRQPVRCLPLLGPWTFSLLEPNLDVETRVKDGDSLIKISKELTGDPGKWREIYAANMPMSLNPDVIKPGSKLRIPLEGAGEEDHVD
ncbi:hypothetical protein KFL_001410210 [Klebsormidium nitens]|uniref:LysM domain-containing protein n=1 Tax=Klebsormidium nitens TaxID=105231 RepID=A0A0U9HJS6_KLENI|nr:hypothetical protein KFL_001410210 [Klebsormidium nitens]|eukprot:GAQ83263.1 hypothetical protein KFL_001410210 [Klebsormidium nitens]